MVILLVEDEAHIRTLVAMLLTCEGYVVLPDGDGDEGLAVSRQFAGAIHLVISDLEMPRKCGDALCAVLARERPGLKALIISSGSSAEALRRAAHLPLLAKPFSASKLTARVQELLEDRAGGHTPRVSPIPRNRASCRCYRGGRPELRRSAMLVFSAVRAWSWATAKEASFPWSPCSVVQGCLLWRSGS